jgi:hypothetical protein
MRRALILAFCAIPLYAQEALPKIEGETLSGKKIALPAAAAGQQALLIIGFTHGSQTQTKAWSHRAGNQFPTWSVVELEDVPRLIRGMVSHSIKGSVPKEMYDRFVLVYHGEKELKQAAGFATPDDAYLLVIDGSGAVRWRFHGAVSDTAMEQLAAQFK